MSNDFYTGEDVQRAACRLRSPDTVLSAVELQTPVRDVRMSNPRMSRQDALDRLAAVRLSAARLNRT